MTPVMSIGATKGHTPFSRLGEYYVYTGEEGEAIAVAQFVTGDAGGVTGKTIATMGVPNQWSAKNARRTQEEINQQATLIAEALNVATETGMGPRAMADEVERLKALMRDLAEDAQNYYTQRQAQTEALELVLMSRGWQYMADETKAVIRAALTLSRGGAE